MTIALIMVAGFAVYVFRNYWWRIIRARRDGTETEAVVDRIEEIVKTSDGAEYRMRNYYVLFRTEDGLENEEIAQILNVSTNSVYRYINRAREHIRERAERRYAHG